jgi:hypothetical protein
MWVGAGAYLAGPAWLCFTVLGAVLAATTDHALVPAAIALPIALATAAVLLGPRVFGVIATLAQRKRRIAHGGVFFVILSGICELILGSLLGPLMMIHHTRIVLSILTGSSIRWSAQNRRASGGRYVQIARSELFSTLLGIAAAFSLWSFAPQLLLWLAPIWVPLVCAIPLALLVSSATLGRLVARIGVFMTPSETEPDDLLLRAQDFCALTKADEAARFRDLVLDPLLLTAQLKRLRAARKGTDQPAAASASEREALAMLLKRALRVGPAALAEAERASLAQDIESLRVLHREAWRALAGGILAARSACAAAAERRRCAAAAPFADLAVSSISTDSLRLQMILAKLSPEPWTAATLVALTGPGYRSWRASVLQLLSGFRLARIYSRLLPKAAAAHALRAARLPELPTLRKHMRQPHGTTLAQARWHGGCCRLTRQRARKRLSAPSSRDHGAV